MQLNPIATIWRENAIEKLRDRYGLAEEEARKKADAWLQWLETPASVSRPAQAYSPQLEITDSPRGLMTNNGGHRSGRPRLRPLHMNFRIADLPKEPTPAIRTRHHAHPILDERRQRLALAHELADREEGNYKRRVRRKSIESVGPKNR